MATAIRYDEFGGVDVLRVDEVERPVAGGRAGPGTSEGGRHQPPPRPSWSWSRPATSRASRRRSHGEVAGGLFVAGATAWGAVHAVQPKQGETVVISGAAGGVGSLAVQLARRTGATVIGLASESNHEWLKSHGVIPVAYGDGVADRIRAAAPSGVDAFIDTYGDGYVELALALGVAAERIDTIVDFAAAAKHGVKTDGGTAAGPGAKVLAELAGLIADGHLEVPIANVYPLAQVREAYTELERRHTHGKIVLRP